jgi:hypothetical protein
MSIGTALSNSCARAFPTIKKAAARVINTLNLLD